MDNLLGEFCGMVVLIVFGGGVCANLTLTKSKGVGGGWICVSAGWGFAVLLGVFTASALGAPQADINPAVTLAKTFVGVYTAGQAIVTMIAQVAGGIVGGAIVWLAYLPHWKETEDKAAKLGIFCTAPAIRDLKANFLTEFLATATLVFGILGIGAQKSADGLSPLVVGGLIFVLGLSLGGPTGYAMNPARDLGPRIAHAILPIAGKGDSDWSYSWVPVFGPIVGSIAGALLFIAVF